MLSILVLFIISIVIFTSVGFLGFGDDQFCEDCDDDDPVYCENLWNCFFVFFNTGIRTGGDLADIMYETFVSSDSLFYGQIIFLVGFYIVVGVLLFNMVTGLILDTFSSEREAETARKEKRDNETFISGLQRAYCNEKGINFKLLNETDQSVWNYLFYILYLRIKDHQEYSGVEYYVDKRLQENDTSWFPHFTSFSLKRAQAVKADDESVQAKVVFGKIAHSNGGNMSRKSGNKSRKRGGDGAKDSSYQRALKKLHKAEEENQILKDANRALRSTIDMLKERLENLEEGG
mmetsp:Transcript_3141/g.5755  ORF Transcript_3141/g.5755 Transcript_3141/m.5755 type:complete len:290 (+) Transcript_3141:743-1612(+)